MAKQNITTPVGRMVLGNLYKANTTDVDGKPLVTKTGPNAGQPTQKYFFALAIPKGTEQSWAQTPWGQIIYQTGVAAFPQATQRPDFAWKIEDGDSQIPNKRGRKPCDTEGYPGHWIVRISSSFAPRTVRLENNIVTEEKTVDFIKPGYYVQVALTVDGNGSAQTPGVYLNPVGVCFIAFGEEINFGPDLNAVGFGSSALPAGASATPLGTALPLTSAVALPPNPLQTAASNPLGVPAAVLPGSIAGVTPNPGFLAVPGSAGSVGIAPPPSTGTVIAPPATSPSRMTAKAQGTFEQYLANGWTEAQLIANGYMTA